MWLLVNCTTPSVLRLGNPVSASTRTGNKRQQHCSADRVDRRCRPLALKPNNRTQSSCKYRGALRLMQFATSSNLSNLILRAVGSQCRSSQITADTGGNLGTRSSSCIQDMLNLLSLDCGGAGQHMQNSTQVSPKMNELACVLHCH